MHSRSIARGGLAGLVAVLVAATPALAQDTRITVGSPESPFSRNKQNEPAVAIDQLHRNVLAAGANDNIDMEACNAGTDNTCPFTDGVGASGISFSTNGGGTWTQPTYTGLSARSCTGAVGDTDPPCEPRTGPIGTLPNYDSNDLVSDGDPAVAFGPRYLGGGRFSTTQSRLVLREPDLGAAGHDAVQGFRGDRGVAHGRHRRGRWPVTMAPGATR